MMIAASGHNGKRIRQVNPIRLLNPIRIWLIRLAMMSARRFIVQTPRLAK